MPRQFSTWFGVIVLLLAVLVFATQFKFRNVILLGLLSHQWPETEGVIFHSNMETVTDQSLIDSAPNKGPLVVYRFTVGDEEYEGYNIRFSRGLFPEYWIPEDMNQYKKGNKVTVYYNANNPKESVLMRGFKPIFGLAEFTLLFLLLTVIGILIFLKIYNRVNQKRMDEVMVDRSRREMIQRQQHQQQQQFTPIPDDVMVGVWQSPDGLIELKLDKTWLAKIGDGTLQGTWYLDDRELGILVTEGDGRNDPVVGMKTIFEVLDHHQQELQLMTLRQMKLGREISSGIDEKEIWKRSNQSSLSSKDLLS